LTLLQFISSYHCFHLPIASSEVTSRNPYKPTPHTFSAQAGQTTITYVIGIQRQDPALPDPFGVLCPENGETTGIAQKILRVRRYGTARAAFKRRA